MHRSGLRSLGLVWSRPNIFGHGVPFAFPRSPDTGPGLTPLGKELVRACNRLGVMIDVSHLNEQGFWDVAKLSSAPLVATHACVHAICPSTRNLTDRQLDAIRESDGIVGVNFSVNDVRPDANLNEDTPLHVLTRHFRYLAERIGIDRVAVGCQCPRDEVARGGVVVRQKDACHQALLPGILRWQMNAPAIAGSM